MNPTLPPTTSSPSSAVGPVPASVGAPAVEPVAELSAAGRRFGDVIALDAISLAVAAGERPATQPPRGDRPGA